MTALPVGTVGTAEAEVLAVLVVVLEVVVDLAVADSGVQVVVALAAADSGVQVAVAKG